MTQTAHKKNFKICLVSISLAKGGAERSVAMLSQMLSHRAVPLSCPLFQVDIPVHSKSIVQKGKVK